jgi:hypothetical protein
MRIYISLVLLISKLLILIKSQEGISLAITENQIKSLEKGLIGSLMGKLPELTQNIPDQSIPGKFAVNLTDIKVDMGKLSSENIDFGMGSDNVLSIKFKKISAQAKFNAFWNFFLLNGYFRTKLNLKDFSLTAHFRLNKSESTINKGHYLPSLTIMNGILDNLDYEVEFYGGSYTASILNLLKSFLRKYLDGQIRELLSNLNKNYGDEISKIIETLPTLYEIIPATEKSPPIYLDYSLLNDAAPIVKHNKLFMSIKGEVISGEQKKLLFKSPSKLRFLQEEEVERNITLSVNFNVLNPLIKILVDGGVIPKLVISPSDEPLINGTKLKLDTTLLETVIEGTIETFGKDKLLQIECQVKSSEKCLQIPSLDVISLELPAICSILILKDEKLQPGLTFETKIFTNLLINLSPPLQAAFSIQNLNLKYSQITQTAMQKADIAYVEQFFNFLFNIGNNAATNMISPLLDQELIQVHNMTTNSGLDIDNVNTKLNNNLFELQLDPVISDPLFAKIADYIWDLLTKKADEVKSLYKKEVSSPIYIELL